MILSQLEKLRPQELVVFKLRFANWSIYWTYKYQIGVENVWNR